MKYEFKIVDLDDFILEYEKDENGIITKRTIPFRRTIEMAQKLQSINADAREKMFFDLNKKGRTKNDYIIVRKNQDGTTTYDETNYRELEKQYLDEARTLILNEITKITLGLGIAELLVELNITTDDQAMLLSQKFFNILNKAGEKDTTFPRVKAEPLPTSFSQEEQNNI